MSVAYSRGDTVHHKRLGAGEVVSVGDSTVVIRFGDGEKTFVPELAPLTKLDAGKTVTARRSKRRTRPKGYAEWRPQAETQIILAQVDEVLREYRAQLPLTVRQIFYRLVGAHDFPKTEQAYERLGNYLVRARRARLIPFEHIRDDSHSVMNHRHFDGQEDFYAYVHRLGRNYKQDKLANQDVSIRVHCEAEGMMPQLHAALEEFSIPVYSCSGFDSLTARRELARWCHDTYVYRGKDPIMFHLGDYDPDGESIFDSLVEDVRGFLNVDAPHVVKVATFERVALTPAQVEMYNLPTAPPKKSSSRTKRWSGSATCQLEALPPDVLERELVEYVEMFLDQEALEDAAGLEVTACRRVRSNGLP